jgi:hypothetical protein
MQLPFSHDQFLEVFASCNRALWPVALALWLATAAMFVQLVRRHSVGAAWVAGLLAAHWAWAGLAYHLAFFRAINPAAVVFAALFVMEAVLFMWRGVARGRLVLTIDSSWWSSIGVVLVAYSLAYPFVHLMFGLSYPRIPTFGVPCPTGILTAGCLILTPAREARWLAPIPLIWAVVGGSAAFVLGIRADVVLAAAGALLLVYVVRAKCG